MTSVRALWTPRSADTLVRICGMFGSAHDGERAAAARLADEHVRRLGLRWADVLRAPPPEWQAMARYCREHVRRLSPREHEFVVSMAHWRHDPSNRQFDWLTAIYERLTDERAER